ncbi:MAG: hypothetical protein AAF192_21195 [Pseudomonadota bacterium]
MRIGFLAAVLATAGCGVVYTSPDVFDSAEEVSLNNQTSFDVSVIPMTFDSTLEANMSPYVPARLPDAFRPAPSAPPAPLSAGSARARRVNVTASTLPPRVSIALLFA